MFIETSAKTGYNVKQVSSLSNKANKTQYIEVAVVPVVVVIQFIHSLRLTDEQLCASLM